MRWRIGSQLPSDGYQVIRDNDYWPGHTARSLVTAGIIAWLKPEGIADPACGDATIVTRSLKLHDVGLVYLNDISQPQMANLESVHGDRFQYSNLPAEGFLRSFGNGRSIDVVVMTEFLEHVEDPDEMLRLARMIGRRLVASSPLNEATPGNHEHVWGWDELGYMEMLMKAGWKPTSYQELTFQDPRLGYSYQIWTAE